LFAWTQKDINVLLTSYLTPQSKIQIWRSVQERVSQVAPFLLLDHDPYAVLSEGKLYWIQDAYTVSDRFPYSSPQTDGSAQGMNYITAHAATGLRAAANTFKRWRRDDRKQAQP
jgi:uncharacterized membrane protein (UPF0182 family)